MPYKTNADLPESIRNSLPAEAQAIFRSAYNSHKERHPDASEEDCMKVAWGAVKRTYKKEGGRWVKKSTGDSIDVRETLTLDAASDVRRTSDGFMVAHPRVARTGVQIYKGREVGRPTMDEVRVYRPEEEVFHVDSLKTYAYRPVTSNHPPVPVVADNWKKYAIGQTGEQIMRDGNFIRVPMVLMDSGAIRDVQDGKRELSLGYSMDLLWEPGLSPDGEAYDAVQTRIRANHLAVVAAARGGSNLRIGDDQEGVGDMNLQSLTVDGLSVEMTDMAAKVVQRHIDALKGQISKLEAKLKGDEEENKKKTKDAEDAATSHKKEVETRDAKIATLEQQLKDAQISPVQLDQMVKDRQHVIDKAKQLIGDKLVIDGKSISDIRRQVVDIKLGDGAKGWSDDKVAAGFDAYAATVKDDHDQHDHLADALSHRPHSASHVNDAREKSYDEYNTNLSNAYKSPKAA